MFQEIFGQNCYRLPEKFPRGLVIMDIGAHIGCFSIACFLRGAGEVWSWEPDFDNFNLLRSNVNQFVGSRFFNEAVWRSDRKDQLYFSGYPEASTACGSCLPGCTVGGQNQERAVRSISLDDAIANVTGDGKRRVHLLKIDAEGAEYPALYTSKALELVDGICGECHEIGTLNLPAQVDGFTRYDMQELSDFLEHQGFNVAYERHHINPKMCLFWAKRPRMATL